MSRFSDDSGDEEFNNEWAMFWANVERSFNGRKGTALLRRFVEVLEAMPARRLIHGAVHRGVDVCAVGALVAAEKCKREGIDWAAAVEALPAFDSENDDYSAAHDTADLAKSFGMPRLAAYRIEYENDEPETGYEPTSVTPEDRWERMHSWAIRELAKREPVAA